MSQGMADQSLQGDSRSLPTRLIPASASRAIFFVLIALGIAIRGYHILILPDMTDVVRHMYYAKSILRLGPHAASLTLIDINPGWRHVTWPWQPYIYPPLALLFFLLFAATWPTIFAIKLTLTLIEAANAILIARLTRNRWAGMIYWLCPISIYWVCHQAQFEPVQNLFTLLALLFLPRHLPAALALLLLAVQTKVTAILLLPLFLLRINRQPTRTQAITLLIGLLALTPLFIGEHYYPFISNFLQYNTSNDVSSYFWNPWDPVCSHIPFWQLFPHELISDVLIVILFLGLLRSRNRAAYIAPLLFLATAKFHKNMMVWYMLVWPCFVVPIAEKWVQNICLILWPLLDVVSIMYVFTNAHEVLPKGMAMNHIFSVFQRL